MLSSLSIFAQKASYWIKEGDLAMEDENYPTAKACYFNAFILDSTDFDVTVKYAESLRLTKDYKSAAKYYEKAYLKDKGKLFPEGLYWLATMQQYNADYSQALRNFKKYNKKHKRDKDSYAYRKSEQQIKSVSFAINALKEDPEIYIVGLDEINDDASEMSPVLNIFDSTFYFSRIPIDSGYPSFIKTHEVKFDSLMKDPLVLSSLFGNTEEHISNLIFNTSGERVYFSKCVASNRCRIYQADIYNGEFTNVKPVDQINHPESTTTMPFIATIDHKEVLFFVSDRPGTVGKLDIWWSELNEGIPGPPANAGKNVNSIDNEVCPFWLDNFLYYSSDWFEGFGGFDIVRSKGKHRSFNAPENLGRPINTSLNDLYFKYYPQIDQGFLASNRDNGDNGACCNDLYSVAFKDSTFIELDPYQSLEDLNKYLPVTMYFHNDEPNPNSWDTTTTLSYADAYNDYKKIFPRYLKENTKGLKDAAFEDAAFEVEEFFSFFVDKGMNDLRIFTELLYIELTKGRHVELSIKGFASPRAKNDYNLNLTHRRTSSLVNFMRQWENGKLLPYMQGISEDGGTLDFVEIPFGEEKADQLVSDLLNDEKESIYSRGARLERKIEILSVQRDIPDTLFAELSLLETSKDFGIISSRSKVEHIFRFMNSGTDTLSIDSLNTSCGCTVPSISLFDIAPGESSEIVVRFDPSGKHGEQTKTVLIYTNASTEPQELTIRAIVK